MAATYSNLGLTKQGTGDNSGTWGTVTNDQVIALADEAIAGFVAVDLASASATFTIPDGSSSDGRNAMIELEGNIVANARTITLPSSKTKYYIFRNNTTFTTGTVNVLTSGGSNSIEIPNGETRLIYSDGVEVYEVGADHALVGRQTIYVPAGAMKPLTTVGAALVQVEHTAGQPETSGLAFSGSTSEAAQFDLTFPKSWNKGTISARFHWQSSAADTNGVVWDIQGVAISDGDATDVAYGSAASVTDNAQSTAYDEYVSDESAAMTIAGTPANADKVYLKVSRDVADGSDTIAEDAILTGIEIFYTTDAGNDV